MKRLDVYKCGKCGNMVEVLHVGGGQLVCCGEPMSALTENTSDGAKEKHVPVFEGAKVKVGSIAHPMEKDHYIEWIEVSKDDKIVGKMFLEPGETPEAEFCDGFTKAREYCNKHGLWKAEK